MIEICFQLITHRVREWSGVPHVSLFLRDMGEAPLPCKLRTNPSFSA